MLFNIANIWLISRFFFEKVDFDHFFQCSHSLSSRFSDVLTLPFWKTFLPFPFGSWYCKWKSDFCCAVNLFFSLGKLFRLCLYYSEFTTLWIRLEYCLLLIHSAKHLVETFNWRTHVLSSGKLSIFICLMLIFILAILSFKISY